MKHNFVSILVVRVTAYAIYAKNIVPQYLAKKIFVHLKCIQKLNIINTNYSKLRVFLRLFRKQGRNKKKCMGETLIR